MTAREYERIQEILRKKLKDRPQPTKWEQGFNEGILCAMSILHNHHKHDDRHQAEHTKA